MKDGGRRFSSDFTRLSTHFWLISFFSTHCLNLRQKKSSGSTFFFFFFYSTTKYQKVTLQYVQRNRNIWMTQAAGRDQNVKMQGLHLNLRKAIEWEDLFFFPLWKTLSCPYVFLISIAQYSQPLFPTQDEGIPPASVWHYHIKPHVSRVTPGFLMTVWVWPK